MCYTHHAQIRTFAANLSLERIGRFNNTVRWALAACGNCANALRRALVSIDEWHVDGRGNIRRAYGYAPRGSRPSRPVDHSGWRTRFNVFMALTVEGILAYHITLANGDREFFEAFMAHAIVPLMQPLGQERSIALLDNARIHNSRAVADQVNSKHAKILWLPPYCYWWQAIESAIHQVKDNLRDGDMQFASMDVAGQMRMIVSAISRISPTNGDNYLRHAGW